MTLAGKIIGNDFKIIKRIGFGGDSEVFLALQLSAMKRKCAIKVYRKPYIESSKMTPFKREKTILSIVNSDLFPTLYRTGLIEGTNRPYLAIEFISGTPLNELLKNNQALDLNLAMQILERLVEGLNELHINQIIHRDIKPSNIFIIPKWEDLIRVKIIDFSHSRLSFEGEERGGGHDSEFIGTFLYMPPEQAFSGETDSSSDVFSLALVFYEMLTGVKAVNLAKFKVENYIEYLKKDYPIPTYSLGTFRPELPASLDYIIKKACSKDKSKRFQDVIDFYKEIKKVLVSRYSMNLKKEPCEKTSFFKRLFKRG